MTKTKKIAFDARFYAEAGPGRYVKNILEQLENIDTANEYLVFMRSAHIDTYKPKNSNFKKIEADYPWYSFKEQTLFFLKLLSMNPDLLYVPHFNIPVLYPKKIITAIPDIIMHSFSTEKGTTLPKPYFKLKKFIYKLVTRWAIYRSSFVIVPSNATKNEIIDAFGTSEQKLIYAPEGVDKDINAENVIADAKAYLEKHLINSPYILYTGSMYEHKNIPLLIDAFNKFICENKIQLTLVLAGKHDKFSDKISKYIVDKKLEDKVKMPGQVEVISDTAMNTLRANCLFYIFPSLKEGFSLTPMEAMRFNKACAISDIPCHREIYADSVLYFDPARINDISDAISSFTQSDQLRKEFTLEGEKILSKYTWTETAKVTLDSFNAVLKNT